MNETVITLFGTIDRYWYNKNYLKYFLDKAKGQPVRLKVSSYGGDVAEAVAMSALMAEHGNVTVEFISFNASAATVLAFGAKSIEMHEDGMWLAHKCSLGVDIWGQLNADQLEDTIKELQNKKKSAEAIDLMIAQKYINRSGKSLKDIITLMEEERWMPAAEAKEWGFIDKIIPGTHKKPQVTNEMTDCFTALGLPLPAIDSEGKPEPEGRDKNLVSQIIDGIKGLFPTGNKTDISNSSNTVMRKEFTFINQILNSEGIEEKDGKMLLTVENLQAINDAVKTEGYLTVDGMIRPKLELGDGYGMRGASALGKEWYEHSAGYCSYLKGKTEKEVADIPADGSDADLAALCTISIDALQKAAGDAFENAGL